MTYAAGYEHDIFISYAHDDNAPAAGAGPWVDEFHTQLENTLKKRRGLPVEIWRDRELGGNTLFDVAIENRLKSSALFIALHSRNYARSDYCRKELEFFSRHRQDALAQGETSRILNVRLNNIPHKEWHPAFAGSAGFAFNDAGDDDELGDFTSLRDPAFEKQLRKLVDAIQTTLEAFPHDAPLEVAPSEAPRVFLAAVSETLTAFQQRVACEIRQRGAVPLEMPPPFESAAHTEAVHDALSTAAFSVHLLSELPGFPVIDAPAQTYPRAQADLARSVERPSILWIPEKFDARVVEDAAHRAWLQELRGGARGGHHYEIVEGSHNTLLDLVRQRLEAVPATRAEDASQAILIDTHQKDQRYAYDLAAQLSNRGADVDFNRESLDALESLENFEDAIRRARNLVIVSGRVAKSWLDARIKSAVKIVAEQLGAGAETLENIWVCLLPPSGVSRIPRLPPVIRIRVLENSDADGIDSQIVDAILAGGDP